MLSPRQRAARHSFGAQRPPRTQSRSLLLTAKGKEGFPLVPAKVSFLPGAGMLPRPRGSCGEGLNRR